MTGSARYEKLRPSFRILEYGNTNPFASLLAGFCFCNFEFVATSTFPMKLHLDGGIDVGIPLQLSEAAPKRKAEFAAGRFCALNAISKMTAGIEKISSGKSGEPIWPRGYTGSITHTAKQAAAIIFRCEDAFSVGIDLEEFISLDIVEEIGTMVLTPKEKEVYQALPNSSQIVTAIFSAKEAIYKAVYPKLQRFVDFQEVECMHISDKFMQFRTLGRLCNELGGRSEIWVEHRQLRMGVLTLCVLTDVRDKFPYFEHECGRP